MNYSEALNAALNDGLKVTRELWEKENAYVVYLENLACLIRVKSEPSQDISPWLAAIDDSLAVDWKVYVNPKSVVQEEIVDLIETVQVSE